jgi:hypothetical protein
MTMYSTFKTDDKAEQEGILLEYDGFRVTVARAGGANKRFKRVLEELARPSQRLIANDAFSNDQADDLLKRVYAKTVVKNWETKVDGEWKRGIENPDGGELLPVNETNVLATFDALPDLYLDIRDQAQKSALFRVALREEAAKNS